MAREAASSCCMPLPAPPPSCRGCALLLAPKCCPQAAGAASCCCMLLPPLPIRSRGAILLLPSKCCPQAAGVECASIFDAS
eukprot:1140986-Pelagomonas_calceolata.AAC.1